MEKIFVIYLMFFLTIFACTPSNIKRVKTVDGSNNVRVKFEGYEKIKIKETRGFKRSILFKISIPLYDEYSGSLLSVSKDIDGLKKCTDFYANIPECSLSYNRDSTILYVAGGVEKSFYLISKQLSDGYNVSISSFGIPKDMSMSLQEKAFLEKLIHSILILDN